jgi:antitoxin YefM
MAQETTYSKLRAELASVLDRVTGDREVVIVHRRGAKDVALIAADELSSLMETAHLLRSPKNARRLTKSLKRAEREAGRSYSVEDLSADAGVQSES